MSTRLDLGGRRQWIRREGSHRYPISRDGHSWRRQWLTTVACGLFGLSMVMLVVVLNGTSRPNDSIAEFGPVPPSAEQTAVAPPSSTAPISVAPQTVDSPAPAPKPEPPAPHSTQKPDIADLSPREARDYAQHWGARMRESMPGLSER